MGTRMELVAGDVGDVLVVIGAGDHAHFADPDRFRAHLSLGAGMDPTWLDMFSEAARRGFDGEEPIDLLDARTELDGPETGDDSGLIIERVDPGWITAVARIPDTGVAALTGRWIDRIEQEIGTLPPEEKPWIRELAARIVAFCRAADRAPDVIFVWSLR
jgi:hypothetical protein